jgi:hypothetical protein
MILIGYRHGLRASELCDLQWSQVEPATGRLHVLMAAAGKSSRYGHRDYRPASGGHSVSRSSPCALDLGRRQVLAGAN